MVILKRKPSEVSVKVTPCMLEQEDIRQRLHHLEIKMRKIEQELVKVQKSIEEDRD